MPTYRKSCRRYHTPGDAHFLTFSCYRRIPLLGRDRSRQWFIKALQLGQQKNQFDLWAYVVMPEHVHLVLLPLGNIGVSEILSTIKQSVSKRAIIWLKQNSPEHLLKLRVDRDGGKPSHRFWQRGGGYDRNLRSVRDIHEKIAYVHQNPVRRGLASSANQWRWSSAAAWEQGLDDPMKIDRESLPRLSPKDVGLIDPLA